MVKTCSIEGCDSPHEARGWCAAHWMAWKRHGDPFHRRPTALQRWQRNIDTSDGPDACWPWTKSLSRVGGYGQFYDNGARVGAHRWAYQHFVGPIPADGHVLHRCDNPPCCNPAHLFIGTNAENTADKMAKGRHATPHGEAVRGAKLAEESVREIRRRVAGGESRTSLSAEFGVSMATICLIVKRQRWAHVE